MTNAASSISSPEVQSLKNDIHDLESTLQISHARQDWWNGWYLRLGVAALSLATLLGIASWVCQKKASSIELASRPDSAKLADKNTELRNVIDRAAQVEVSKAQTDAFNASERAGRAEQGAGEAKERAAKAQASLATAEQHSAEANAKAEGFRLDIAKSNEAAAQAQAQVAGAMAEAAKANLELARIKSPRVLSIPEETLTALRAFPGSEYTFSGVQTDQDSIDFLKQIDAALQSVGWKRVNPYPPAVMGVNVFGDDGFRVTIAILKGVKVEVGCPVDASSLQHEPPVMWPMAVKLAGGLRNAIASSTTPMSDRNVAPDVVILKGASEVIRISVGSKP
jgi:hypothetical protein